MFFDKTMVELQNIKNAITSSSDELLIIDKTFTEQKLIIPENKENNSYFIKDTIVNKELPINKKIVIKNIEYKLIMKQIYKGSCYIITGLFDGELYIVKNTNIMLPKKDEKEFSNESFIIKTFDKSWITSLEIDKEEKYIIYGTQKGSLVIFSLNYNLFKEGKNFIKLHKFFLSHSGFSLFKIKILFFHH